MFKFIAVLVLGAACASAIRPELDENWEAFKETFDKAYAGDEEESARREVWEANFDLIATHNEEYEQGLHTFALGENQFADMTNEEFLQAYLPPWPESDGFPEDVPVFVNFLDFVPDSIDWREKNVVTPVKDQKQCGSCWAFSATGSMEGVHAIKTGTLVSLSEQNLVDCSADEGNMGCGGGFPDWAFEYVIKNKGIDTEDSYPYVAENQKCAFNPANIGATISNYTMIKKGVDSDLLAAIAQVGPISVGMDASSYEFQLYKSGIYKPKKCSKQFLDHGVLAVGFGEDRGQKYWIVKNSWGTSWGQQGYFLMDRDETNMCGITTRSFFPVV